MSEVRPQKSPVYMTREQYLEFEQTSLEKHDWINGRVVLSNNPDGRPEFEMQGGTYRHSRVMHHLNRHVGNAIDGTNCVMVESNLRLSLGQADRYVYPDAQLICGEPVFDPADRKQTTITNPTVIFEVLSDSTETHDRSEKLHSYLVVPTVQVYVLVATREPRVEWFIRQPDAAWSFRYAAGLNATFALAEPALSIELSALYAGLTFDPPAEEPT